MKAMPHLDCVKECCLARLQRHGGSLGATLLRFAQKPRRSWVDKTVDQDDSLLPTAASYSAVSDGSSDSSSPLPLHTADQLQYMTQRVRLLLRDAITELLRHPPYRARRSTGVDDA